MSDGSQPPILVIVRESPLRQRTAALLQSIVAQKPEGLADVVILRVRRHRNIGADSRGDRVREVTEEADWLRQALRLIEESRCQWVVLPSSVDRYLPGAFGTVVKRGTAEDEAVVFGCRVKRGERDARIGPDPFRFDYFALLSGFNYIAPGAVFMSTRRLKADGGFDPRFPNAVAFEYLLRTGAAHGIAACDGTFLETEANPFPGISREYAALSATETTLATLHYNRCSLAAGTTLALVGVVAQQLEAVRYAGHDERLASVLGAGGRTLTERYLESMGLDEGRASQVEEADPSDGRPTRHLSEPDHPDLDEGKGAGLGATEEALPSAGPLGEGLPPADPIEQEPPSGGPLGEELPSEGPVREEYPSGGLRKEPPFGGPIREEPRSGGSTETRNLTIWDASGNPTSYDQGLRARIRAMSPRGVWNTLRRTKRAWQAFCAPLD